MKRLAGSAAVGLGATLLMEHASSFLYKRQSEAAREREEWGRKENMPTTTLVRKLAGAFGRDLDDEKAQRLGMVAHYAFGAGGGRR